MWNEFIYYAGLRCIYFIWIVSIFVLHSVLPLHFPKNFCIFLCTFPVSVQSTPFLHGSKVKLWDNPSNAQFMPYSKVRSKSLHLTSNPVFIVNRTIFVTLTFPSINSLLLPLLYVYKGWWHSNIKSRSLIILTFRTHTPRGLQQIHQPSSSSEQNVWVTSPASSQVLVWVFCCSGLFIFPV